MRAAEDIEIYGIYQGTWAGVSDNNIVFNV